MKKLYLVLAFLLCVPMLITAQSECLPGKPFDFNGHYDTFKSIILLDTSDYLTGGSTLNSSPNNSNMCFARIDICGDSIWTRAYGQLNESFIDADIYYKSGDNFVVSATAHYSFETTEYSYALLKLSLEGDTIWLRKYLGGLKTTGPKDVIQTVDGGFAMVGFSQNFPNDYARIWFIKTDAEGNMEWNRYYGTDNNSESGEHLLQLPDGGYLILGRRNNVASELVRIWLIRTDAQGEVLWERFYGNNYFTHGAHIIPISDGYMIVGTQHPGTTWQTNGDAYVLKTDTFGLTQWSHTFGGYYYEQFDKIMQLADGNFMILGSTSTFGTGGGSPDGWLFKISVQGDSLWSRTYRYETAADRSEYLWDFQPAPQGGFMIAGFAGRVFPNNQDAWVIRTDSLGNPCPPDNGCWVVSVPPNPLKGENILSVYPNPAQDLLHLQNWQNIAVFNLYSISGMVAHRYSPVTGAQIAIAELPAGLYIAEAQYKNGTTQRQKLLIHR